MLEIFWKINLDGTVALQKTNLDFKELSNLPVLHFNRCLETEYSETTAHCNGNVDTDSQIYVPYP
jgi:hypothetical protein